MRCRIRLPVTAMLIGTSGNRFILSGTAGNQLIGLYWLNEYLLRAALGVHRQDIDIAASAVADIGNELDHVRSAVTAAAIPPPQLQVLVGDLPYLVH